MTHNLVAWYRTPNPKREPVVESTATSKTESESSKVAHRFLPMTIRRKKTTADGEVEVIESPITNPWLRLLLSTHGWRLVILLMILSMHPLGRGILAVVGFEFPDTRKIAVAAENANATKAELTTISDAVREIRADVTNLKASNSILQTKVDGVSEKQTALELKVTGFQVDWNKWRPKEEPK